MRRDSVFRPQRCARSRGVRVGSQIVPAADWRRWHRNERNPVLWHRRREAIDQCGVDRAAHGLVDGLARAFEVTVTRQTDRALHFALDSRVASQRGDGVGWMRGMGRNVLYL